MGTNLFVEGWPSPIVLSVTLPREAHRFQDVSEITRALSEVDTTLRRDWDAIWPSYRPRRRREVWLLRFRVDSPPFFEILTDPAWLAVFIVAITGYKQGKESARELARDGSRLLSGVKGLSDRELQLLEISVRMTLESWMEAGEYKSIALAKRFRRIRQRLVGDSEDLPDIEVRNVDRKNQPW